MGERGADLTGVDSWIEDIKENYRTEKEDLWRRIATLEGRKEILKSCIVGDNLDIRTIIGNSPPNQFVLIILYPLVIPYPYMVPVLLQVLIYLVLKCVKLKFMVVEMVFQEE